MKKFKVVPWGNIETGERFFGIGVTFPDGTKGNLSSNNKPLFFDTREKAKTEVARLNSLEKSKMNVVV